MNVMIQDIEIIKNYKYMREHNIKNYVKFQNLEVKSCGKNPQLFYTLYDGVLYKFNGCSDCNYSYKCKAKKKNKDENYRYIELISDYELLKKDTRNNLLSTEVIEIKINRLKETLEKHCMNYDRIRRRGLQKVSVEIILMCLGVNVRRHLSSIDENKFKKNCWKTPGNL